MRRLRDTLLRAMRYHHVPISIAMLGLLPFSILFDSIHFDVIAFLVLSLWVLDNAHEKTKYGKRIKTYQRALKKYRIGVNFETGESVKIFIEGETPTPTQSPE